MRDLVANLLKGPRGLYGILVVVFLRVPLFPFMYARILEDEVNLQPIWMIYWKLSKPWISTDSIPAIFCEASDLPRLPPLSLDPVGEQVQTNILALSSVVSSIEEKITSLTKPPSDPSSSSPMVGKRTQQGATYAQIAFSICPPPNSDTSASSQKPQRPLYDDIRESNVILFGLPEEKSIVETKAVVDEVFEFLAGRPVAIKDIFRLGKFRQSANPCPLLVKLSAIWDRKLLLVQKKNLCEFSIGRLST